MNTLYKLGKEKYPLLFKPIKIGPIIVPNRLFFPPICFNWANPDGTMSDKLHDFYVDLAEGGNGMIITGCAAVSPDSILYQYTMRIHDKKHVPGLKKLCTEIEKRGSIPAIQLMNFGRQARTTYTGKPVYAPSAIPCPVISQVDPNYKIREMTLEDIERVRNDFVDAAVLSAEAGFKVVQVHAAHGYLLSNFLSPYTNHRTDQYGGSVENRTRFIVEIIQGIRRKLGNAVAIDIRVSGDELVEGGLKPHDFKEIISRFEKAGIDMVNVSLTIFESAIKFINQPLEPQGRFATIAQEIRSYAGVPVGHAAFILSLEVAENLLREGKIDLVGIGRAQFADPGIIRKQLEGKKFRKCIYDGKCLEDLITPEYGISYCTVNPKYMRPKIERT
jgi:2,4-dienoyl-CoA reductase-like NADH-dependent reductase (Old Yellow Enzyme family)